MRINGIKVETNGCFAYDGCHKIYIIEDYAEQQEALDSGYTIVNIHDLPSVYYSSCPLRFINNWALDKTYAPQCEDAIFEGFNTYDGFDDYEIMEILEDEEDE